MPQEAICPECGALVPLVRDRWLHLHNVGSTAYTFAGPDRPRCPGSFILATGRGRAGGRTRTTTSKAASR